MSRHTTIRLLHDLGAAVWFGGALMGATGLNGAAAQLDDPRQRSSASTAGWSRWAPLGGAAVVAHTIGAAGLARTDAARVASQRGVGRSSAVKTALTAAGLGVSAWSAALNRTMAAAGPVPVRGATEASAATPRNVVRVQSQLRLVQWLNPLVAGAVIAAGSWQSEQQRTAQVVPGVLTRLGGRLPVAAPAVAVLGLSALALSRRRGGSSTTTVESYPVPPVVRRPAEPDTATATTTGVAASAPPPAVPPPPPGSGGNGVGRVVPDLTVPPLHEA